MRKIIFATLNCGLFFASAQVNIWSNHPSMKKVEMTPYLAAGDGNIAIVVCPGGSYFWHDLKTEGHDVALWLQKNGISAFVLEYRTAGVAAFITHYRLLSRGTRYPDPQDDLAQAIRYIKAHSEDYHIDSNKVGAMGFSAGGHLVVSVATMCKDDAKPAFVASLYPVVTFTADCVHKRSRRALLGDDKVNDEALKNALSLERIIDHDCSPVFLVNCMDDPIVKYHNSELIDSALTANDVEHKYIQYKTGGHGFGASDTKGTKECRAWKNEFLKWLKQRF